MGQQKVNCSMYPKFKAVLQGQSFDLLQVYPQ